jgi:putative serine protease PepD
MPFDEEPEDAYGFQPPLPPEDRLWRHPSELGPAGATNPITIVNRPVTSARTWLVVVLGALLGSGLTVAGLALTGTFEREVATPPVEQIMITPPDRPTAEALAVAEQVSPAVVRIESTGPAGTSDGTGVLFRTDGYLLTTADAVNGADTVVVTFQDGRTEPAELVGIDRDSDIAVAKVGRSDVPASPLGQPGRLTLGETTIVISSVPGRPRAPLIGEGLLTALSQRVTWGEERKNAMYGMLQTSVRLTIDASGAPLIDRSGAVIGIVSRRGSSPDGLTRTADGSTAGDGAQVWYAVPIDWAKHLADQIIADGSVTETVWMGVRGDDLDDERADLLGRGAAEIFEVNASSPAAEAGLREGDVITGVDDEPVTTWSDLIVRLRMRQPGDIVSVSYLRADQEEWALVTLAGKSSTP